MDQRVKIGRVKETDRKIRKLGQRLKAIKMENHRLHEENEKLKEERKKGHCCGIHINSIPYHHCYCSNPTAYSD